MNNAYLYIEDKKYSLQEFNFAFSQPKVLGHELIHAYHYHFDRGEYFSERDRRFKPKIGFEGRKKDKSPNNISDYTKKHYSNEEEKLVTNLSNQINKALGEDLRWDL